MRPIRAAALVLGLLVVAYLLLWPVPIEPVAWDPPPAPELAGVYAPNNRLAAVERLASGAGVGPEDVAVDARGWIYTGYDDGRLVRLSPDGHQVQELVRTGGRPLGLALDGSGDLIVADAHRGLLRWSAAGELTVLATEQGGRPFGFTDGVAVGPDGTIYFTDATWKARFGEGDVDMWEHRGNGRLLAYDPSSGATRLLADGLQFANGVAVSPAGDFLLVAETASYRLRRYWLGGSRAGDLEAFIDNLPGFPDGVSCNGRDTFWVSLVSPRSALVDAMARLPFWRKVFNRLPRALYPSTPAATLVVGVGLDGSVLTTLQADPPAYANITNAREHDGVLYLGSLTENALGRLALR